MAVVTALVTAVVIIGALVEFSYWRENQPDMTGLTTKVMDSMNQSLSTDKDFAKMGLHVKSISVMRAAGDMFEGQATREVDHQVVTSPAAGSRRLLLTPLGREGPVQPVGCCALPSRLLGCDASIAGRRNPLG